MVGESFGVHVDVHSSGLIALLHSYANYACVHGAWWEQKPRCRARPDHDRESASRLHRLVAQALVSSFAAFRFSEDKVRGTIQQIDDWREAQTTSLPMHSLLRASKASAASLDALCWGLELTLLGFARNHPRAMPLCPDGELHASMIVTLTDSGADAAVKAGWPAEIKVVRLLRRMPRGEWRASAVGGEAAT